MFLEAKLLHGLIYALTEKNLREHFNRLRLFLRFAQVTNHHFQLCSAPAQRVPSPRI